MFEGLKLYANNFNEYINFYIKQMMEKFESKNLIFLKQKFGEAESFW